MILKLQKLIIKRPITTLMIYLAFLLFGFISLTELKLNLLPNMEFPRITIITQFANSAPSEIENLITKPITETVGTINGVENIDSESVEGFSFITIQFKNNKNINFAIMEVRERIDLIRENLPQDANRPIITRFDPNHSPMMELVFFSKGLKNPKDLRSFVQENIKTFIDRVDGVAAVQLSGGYKKEVIIDIDPDRMNSYKLSILDIKNFIRSNNMNYPAGQIPVGNKDVLVRVIGEFKDVSDIGKSVVSVTPEGAPIFLYEFSNIFETYKERTGLARYNGEDCVVAYIYKESSKNTVTISENLHKEIDKIKNQFSKDVNIEVVYDEASFVRESINNLSSNLISGAFLAFIALFLILRNFQSPIVLLLVIPASLLPTFIFFYLMDISLNMMSLGGLTLGIGMLYDSSNVVLSGIERNMEKGESIENSIIKGTGEVTSSIISATLTTVIVFLPISFIKNVIGIVFAEMAKSIVISLLVSLVVSLTLPTLITSFLYKYRNDKINLFSNFFKSIEGVEKKLLTGYENTLKANILRPSILYTGIVILFIISVVIGFYVKKEFVPKVDTGEFEIRVTAPGGYSLNSTLQIISSLEDLLLGEEQVKSVVSNLGVDEDNIFNKNKSENASNKAKMRVVLKEDINSQGFINEFRSKIKLNSEIEISFQPGNDIIGNLLSQKKSEIEFLVLGNDLNELSEIGKKIKTEISNIEGVLDVRASLEEKSSEWKLKFDNLKMSKFNFTNEFLSSYIKTASYGSISSKMRFKDYETEIRIRFKKNSANTIDKLMKTRIKTPFNQLVEVSQFSEIEDFKNLNSILRHGNFRVNLISASLEPKLASLTSEKLEKYIKNLQVPEGYKIQYSGNMESLNKSMDELIVTFILTLLFIYMLLAGQFESLKYSLVMICTIPLIFIGTFPALYFSDKSLNISSFMGIILLIGVVVDNASLFFEYLNLHLEENFSLEVSIIESGKVVLKPILMNNSTTILGLLPVVIGLGKGGEFQAPLGIVVISGLLSSVVLSLYLIPVLFYSILKKENK